MTVASFLGALRVGAPRMADGFAVVPLIGAPATDAAAPAAGFLTAAEALADDLLEIGELPDGPQVNRVLVRNRADEPVLLLDGETLVGAWQDRVINLTVLVPAQAELVLPVSCVEQGRWAGDGRTGFGLGGRVQPARSRSRRMAQVTAALADAGTAAADQGDVWAETEALRARVRQGLRERGVAGAAVLEEPGTGTLSDVFRAGLPEIDTLVEATAVRVAEPGACGAVFLVADRVVGLDVFAAAPIWRQLRRIVARGHAAEALDSGGRRASAPAARKSAATFLAALRAAPVTSRPGLGLGEDLRFMGDVVGGGLILDGGVVHLAAAPAC